ncbi:MAG: hypothetical protein ABRQ37_26650, partial [Candidatus Eremiobacterota bacterium]
MAKVIDRNVNVGVNVAQQIALQRRRSRGRYLARLRSKSVHYAIYREIQRLLELGILRDRADYEEEYEMEGEEGDDEPEDGEEGELSDDTYDDDKTDDDDELDSLDTEVTDPDDIKKLLKIEMDKVFESQEKVKTFITDEEIIKDWENFKKLCEKIWNALINVDFSRHILMLFDPELVREILKISEINLTEPSQKSNSNLIDKEKVLEILSREKLPEKLYYIFPDLETVEKITRLLEKEYKEIADYIKDKISN